VLLRNPSLDIRNAAMGVFLACLAANVLFGGGTLLSVLYAFANAALVAVETGLVRKAAGPPEPAISSVRTYVAMFVAGGVISPAIVAAFFATFTAGALGWPLLGTFGSWVVGEALGFAVVLPVLMLASREALAALAAPARLVRLAATVGASILLAVAAASWAQLPFLLVIVPLLGAAAFLAPFELAVACGAVGAGLVGLAVAGVLSGLDPSGSGFAYGFQLSVGIVAALPFVSGLAVEQMQRDRRRIAESEQRFRRAMEDSVIGVAIVALDGRVVEANDAFADMLGYSRKELEQVTLFEITHPDDVALGAEALRRVRAGDMNSYGFEKRYLRKDGTAIWTRLSGSVIRDADTGAPLHLVSQIEDIDARKRADEAIERAETRWSFALACAGQGMWDVDLKKGRTTYSSTWKQMLGYGDDEMDGDPYHWLSLVHPDDRERVEAADRRHIAGLTPMFEAEFRMRHKQGHWIWILDRGQIVERGKDGTPLRAIGTLTDITMRHEAEDRLLSYATQLADEKERLRVTLDSIGDAVICTDAALGVTFMNPIAEKLTGIAECEALGKPLTAVYAPVDEESGERIATEAALPGLRQRVEHNSRAVLSKKDGSVCCIREVVSPILNERGEFSGSVIVFQDFTDARALQRRLAHAAAHDSLTGLANRASLRATLSGLVAAPRASAGRDFLLYVDLDNFKLVNDTGGHAAGDMVLRQVAETLKAAVGDGGTAARVGGDEFALILRDCRPDAAEALARQLVDAVGRLGFEQDGVACSIGASVGLTAIGDGEADIDAIMVRADRATYQAKTKGGGCVVTAAPAAAAPEQPQALGPAPSDRRAAG
jgi:diguanylate cyclase (GGDEF)-like protein/PAS domain S-box-containing protein